MADHPPLPEFGDEIGLYRLEQWARARVRASARPPAERAAILAEIERRYRAALETGVAERQAGEKLVANHAIGGDHLTSILDGICALRGTPAVIHTDNGAESHARRC